MTTALRYCITREHTLLIRLSDAMFIMNTESPLVLAMLASLMGLLLGSFFNVVIYRLPKMLRLQWQKECHECFKETPDRPIDNTPFNLALPRSHCPQCKKNLRFYHNIPLFSYLYLKGRCKHCQHPIAWQYPFIELLSALSFLMLFLMYGASFLFIAHALFISFLLILVTIDYNEQILPDLLVYSLLWIGLLFNSVALFCPLKDAVMGAFFAYTALWSLMHLYKLLTGKDGMGHGDFKLFAALGAWIGWTLLPITLLLASFIGSIVGVAYLYVSGQDKQTPIPFGPFLGIAGFIALQAGKPITEMIFHIPLS